MAFIYDELVGNCSSPIQHIWVWHRSTTKKTHTFWHQSVGRKTTGRFWKPFWLEGKKYIHSQYEAPDVSWRCWRLSNLNTYHEPMVALVFRVGVKQRIPNATQTLMVGIIHCACPPTFFTNTHNRLICLYPNQGKWFIVLGAWFWTGWQKQTTPTGLLLLSVSRICGNHVDSNSNSSC